ncbi:hypothetical protein ACHAXM_008707 [Skeletonema potamos]
MGKIFIKAWSLMGFPTFLSFTIRSFPSFTIPSVMISTIVLSLLPELSSSIDAIASAEIGGSCGTQAKDKEDC